MWIKTTEDVLLNTECVSYIYYSSKSDSTFADHRKELLLIGSGNMIPTIADAIGRGTKFMEVRNHG